MRIHHDTYSAVQPGKPGSAMYPKSPLGEKVCLLYTSDAADD